MKTWWKDLPLHIKLSLPIQLCLLILLPFAHVWVMHQFESTTLDNVETQTQESATQSLLALNSMMLTGQIGNQAERAVFFNRMSVQDQVVDFHLTRTNAVNDQFGKGLDIEQGGDALDRLASKSGTVQTSISGDKQHVLRVVVPYPAKKDFYGVNCLQCHHVPEGTVLGTISLTVDLKHEYANIQRLSSILLAGQVFLQFLLFFLIFGLIRSITRVVVELEQVVLDVKTHEDFSKRAEIHGNDEIGQIAQVFNGFVSHIEDLHLRLAEKITALEAYYDQNEEDLRIGSDIMSRINYAYLTSDPAVRLQINPAAHYSGDLILVSRTPSNTLHIMLADAVGHGLIAAMNLLPLSQIFNAMSKKGFTVSRIAEEVNAKIHRLMPIDRFIGAALVSIDFRNQVVEVWNGGVPAPILMRADGSILHRWKSRNLPLGILDESAFSSEVESIRYSEDCQLFLFSDGLPEAEAPDGRQFGKERLVQVLEATAPESRFDALMSALTEHLAGSAAHDDVSIAMVNIAISEDQQAAVEQSPAATQQETAAFSQWRIAMHLEEHELKYLGAIPLIAEIVSRIHTAAEHYSPLYVILSELFNNALDHGLLQLDSGIKQGEDGFDNYLRLRENRLRALTGGWIDIEIENVAIDGKYGIKMRVVDSGNGFDYSALNDDALLRPQGQYGRGLALVRSMADRLEFSGKGNDVAAYYICG